MPDFSEIRSGEDVAERVLSDHPDLMVVAFLFGEQGPKGALRKHPNLQSTCVPGCRNRFTFGDAQREVSAGRIFVIPSGLTHGCVCSAGGTLVDCFTPRRDDFL